MSKVILPRADDLAQESYDSRLRLNIAKELQTLKTAIRLIFEWRLPARYSLASIPTAGKYQAGDIVWKSVPVEAGAALSKYVVIGWICTVTGAPGTFLEMRTLTGN